MEQILQRFKLALGIRHEEKDEYFLSRIAAEIEELADQGILIDEYDDSDIQLVADLTEQHYLHPDAPTPPFIQTRIARRITKARCSDGV